MCVCERPVTAPRDDRAFSYVFLPDIQNGSDRPVITHAWNFRGLKAAADKPPHLSALCVATAATTRQDRKSPSFSPVPSTHPRLFLPSPGLVSPPMHVWGRFCVAQVSGATIILISTTAITRTNSSSPPIGRRLDLEQIVVLLCFVTTAMTMGRGNVCRIVGGRGGVPKSPCLGTACCCFCVTERPVVAFSFATGRRPSQSPCPHLVLTPSCPTTRDQYCRLSITHDGVTYTNGNTVKLRRRPRE